MPNRKHQKFAGVAMIKIENVHLDYFSGQHNFSLIARLDGKWAGSLAYSVYEGDVYVRMIDVELKRQGVGTALVLELQRLYPQTEIDFGVVTAEGEKLLASLEWRVEPNREYQRMSDELTLIEQTLRDYDARAKIVVTMSDKAKQEFLAEVADWNELSDKADELQNHLWKSAPEKRFAIGKSQPDNAFQQVEEQPPAMAMAC